jgi:hypothetical protein
MGGAIKRSFMLSPDNGGISTTKNIQYFNDCQGFSAASVNF